ncbi:Hypothetical predicted protein [Podarcis lilfordi]|uniref:Uncharacterized protein n=1 Tax=Podarcis lilfordi TaxID=74358 RepID=A0AA35PT64_9SAUR|nr:Hypothetical predicted protein [Podarcis lilfordi]
MWQCWPLVGVHVSQNLSAPVPGLGSKVGQPEAGRKGLWVLPEDPTLRRLQRSQPEQKILQWEQKLGPGPGACGGSMRPLCIRLTWATNEGGPRDQRTLLRVTAALQE